MPRVWKVPELLHGIRIRSLQLVFEEFVVYQLQNQIYVCIIHAFLGRIQDFGKGHNSIKRFFKQIVDGLLLKNQINCPNRKDNVFFWLPTKCYVLYGFATFFSILSSSPAFHLDWSTLHIVSIGLKVILFSSSNVWTMVCISVLIRFQI